MLNKSRLGLLLLLSTGILFTEASFAETLPKHSWQLGPEVYYHMYKEPSLDVENKGLMYGGAASYTFHGDNRLMFRAEGRGAWGQVDYESGATGSADNIDQTIWEGRLLLGYDFKVEQYKYYTFYTGFGYRRLNYDAGGIVTTTGHLGYDRISNYYYLPLGIEGGVLHENGWLITAMLEVDFLLSGTHKSNLSTTGLAFGDVSNDQNEGFGLRGSIRFAKSMPTYTFSIEPYVRGWAVEDSETSDVTYSGVAVGYGVEPKNRTYEFGANASLVF